MKSKAMQPIKAGGNGVSVHRSVNTHLYNYIYTKKTRK